MFKAMVAKKSEGSISEVFVTFLKLGLTSFGGPIVHLGYFRKELVDERAWITESQFSQLLAICQFLPGPASSQLGFALGLIRAGWYGAVAAFLAFTLPSVILLLGFAALLPTLSDGIDGPVIHGLKLVACAVVADALAGMTKKLCPDFTRRFIAVLAVAVLIFVGSVWMQVAVVVGAAVAGLLFCREVPGIEEVQIKVRYGKQFGLGLFALYCMLLVVLTLAASSQAGLLSVAEAFYRAGALVFGGGHVVLPLLEESVVGAGWVSQEKFLAGYGAAQAIPGPMFAFSAYLGVLIPSEHGAWLPGGVALLCIFLPGFLLVSAVLPVWRAVSLSPRMVNAIAGVNASVVGILAAAFYDPVLVSGIQSWFDLVIVAIAIAMLAVFRLSPLLVVVGCVAATVLGSVNKLSLF